MKLLQFIQDLDRQSKRRILFAFDAVMIPFALLVAFALRYGTMVPELNLPKVYLTLFPMLVILGLGLVFLLGLSRIMVAAFESKAILRTGIAAVGLASLGILLNSILGTSVSRSVMMMFGVLFFVFAIGGRLFWQISIEFMEMRGGPRKRVLVFGAGQAGIQLVSALRKSSDMYPVAIMDDSKTMEGLIVGGLSVMPSSELQKTIEKLRIDRLILAVPSAQGREREAFLERFRDLDCEVQALPSLVEMINGGGLLDALRTVSADELLGRDKVELNLPEVDVTYSGKTVMVTGAGGSIGSELCRQLVECNISRLVLFEHSEFALYQLVQELEPICEKTEIDLVPVLGTVLDPVRLQSAIAASDVQIILHAAAYKHVPLVEQNTLAGMRNNVLGTKYAAEVAGKMGIERFILVSTDKAVRPTNVMGASKRLAELVVQDFATRSGKTLYSMVRFGNVLGSSGSVIPLFKSQIERGGPVTLTHDDVTRYFMTIPEAARLVLIAGSFARGGDVFVLDMGEPVKIRELAQSLIELSGLSVRDENNPDGDIKIDVTGLRPGEKLYEELLIGGDMLTTPHAKILRAQEGKLSEIEIATALKDILEACENDNATAAREVIERWVDGYTKPTVSIPGE